MSDEPDAFGYKHGRIHRDPGQSCTANKPFSEKVIRDIATEFFRDWYNAPGSNTDQGFDAWWKTNRARFGFVADLTCPSCAEKDAEIERLRTQLTDAMNLAKVWKETAIDTQEQHERRIGELERAVRGEG